jgi:hypothetical protein
MTQFVDVHMPGPGSSRAEVVSQWTLQSLRASRDRTPVIWVARPVLAGITACAALEEPHRVEGKLLGHWVIPYWEAVVTDWTGSATSPIHTVVDDSAGGRENRLLPQLELEPSSNPILQPCGRWISLRRRPSASATMRRSRETTSGIAASFRGRGPTLLLALEGGRAKRVRAWTSPRRRWPWELFRAPREAELRAYARPRV